MSSTRRHTTTTDRPAGPSGPSESSAALRREWRRGARDMAPLALGYVPFGLLVGAAVGRSPDPSAGWAGTWTIYGGSAHLAVLDLISGSAAPALAVAAGVLIHLRLLVYATAMASLWAGTPRLWRLGAAAMVVDPLWMLVERRAGDGGSRRLRRAHYLSGGVTLAVTWLAAVTVGAAAGSGPLVTGHLAVAVPLCLVSMVVPHLRADGGLAAVSAAMSSALVTRSWPAGSGLLVSMAVAALAGLASSRGQARS
ncbi:MAG TPA: AzlC family ABC transporter permease [Candidatus Limnocylindrales bacterium]|nr:AzlC family ABC transporter permease [Candidatus Limnocylindrales bacterium]